MIGTVKISEKIKGDVKTTYESIAHGSGNVGAVGGGRQEVRHPRGDAANEFDVTLTRTCHIRGQTSRPSVAPILANAHDFDDSLRPLFGYADVIRYSNVRRFFPISLTP